jgi:hypothetical protein
MTAALLTNPVDYIKLAGDPSPGLADVIGAKRELEYQWFQPPFSSGARVLFKRIVLAEFEVRLRLYNEADLDGWETLRKHLAPPTKRGVAKALDIWHPVLAALDIKAVNVLSYSQLEQIEDGVWATTIKFKEWRGLPQQSLSKVEASKAQPIDPVEQRILDNDQELERLYEELSR